ncbi:MAG: hypothetical protein AAF705_09745 [Bacteroidota bacterium]
MLRYLLFLLFIYCCIDLPGQTKYEKEYRIPVKDVPEEALNYVNQYGFIKRIKWYKEESLTGMSIEAKSKKDKQKYSIEFDTNGQLQDVEIGFDIEKISTEVRALIQTSLNKEFDRFKFRKIQKQYAGPPQYILDYLTGKVTELDPSVRIQFEIVLEGRKASKAHLYEYTFSKAGALVSKNRIVLRNTDILEY